MRFQNTFSSPLDLSMDLLREFGQVRTVHKPGGEKQYITGNIEIKGCVFVDGNLISCDLEDEVTLPPRPALSSAY